MGCTCSCRISAPVVSAAACVAAGVVFATCAGTSSSDPNGNDDVAGYTFDVLNPSTLAVVATKQSPSTSGKANFTMADGLSGNTNYLIRLTVKDKQGASGTANQTLAVGNCAPTAAMAVTPSTTVACGGSATLDASASKDSDGSIASYSWKLVNGNQTITKSGLTAVVSQSADKLTPGATYAVTLTVKDNTGSSAVATGSLGVQAGCVNKPPVCTNAKPSVTRISTLVSCLSWDGSIVEVERACAPLRPLNAWHCLGMARALGLLQQLSQATLNCTHSKQVVMEAGLSGCY